MFRQIHPQLFLGNVIALRDLRILYQHEIVAVVDLAINEPPAQLGRDLIYCRFPLTDGEGNSPAILAMAIRCLSMLVKHELRTLVACSAGMSRSPAIAAAALAIHTRTPLEDNLSAILAQHPHDLSLPLWLNVKSTYEQIREENH
jgi:protein-tyrosine phosphatase